MIAIIDYGAGNLVSVKKAFDFLGHGSIVTSDAADVENAAKVVLPGVGHFASTAALEKAGLKESVALAISRGVPFLGICVGMQWIFEGSAESPVTPGLGYFAGKCERFPASVKSPHVGWNSIELNPASTLFRGVPASSYMYFTHSFRVPVVKNTSASCDYGGKFAAAVERDLVFGVQFHPEKSGKNGLHLLRNFCSL